MFRRDFKGKPDICPISDTTRWTTYFKGLVGTPDADSTDSISHDIRVIRANTLFDGIHGASSADWSVPGYTHRRTAPGVDGIPTQCVKEAWKGDDKEDPMSHILAPHLTKLFNIIFLLWNIPR